MGRTLGAFAFVLALAACEPEAPACLLDASVSTETCPLDACSTGCATVEEGIECCVAAHGRGVEGTDLESLDRSCVGDECDPDLYLSAAAALCAGQVQGFPPGIERCGTRLVRGATGMAWYLENVTAGGCEDGDDHADEEGMYLQIDARTGLPDAEGRVQYLVDCARPGSSAPR